MGLSNEERISGMYFAINAMVEIGEDLKSDNIYPYIGKELYNLTEKLWPATISYQSNSSHWLFGSSATHTITSEVNTVWGVALNEHLDNGAREADSEGQEVWPTKDNKFNPFDCFLDIKGLLPSPHQNIYNLYAWTEQLIYYLRRYKDEFMESFSNLDDLISKIQGKCFSIFSSDEVYGRAYLVHKMAHAIYNPYGEEDVVKKWLIKQNIHHDISRTVSESVPMKELVKLHVKIVKARKKSKEGEKRDYDLCRILTVLELAGRKYHYDHKYKELVGMLEDAGWSKKRLKKIDVAYQKCKAEKEKYDQNQKKTYGYKGDEEISYAWMLHLDDD